MKIEKIQVLKGSNILSKKTRLIEMRLSIGDLEYKLTNTIDGFSERLKTLIPSLYSYKGFAEVSGGFFQAVDNGVSIEYVIEHIVLELQCLAGMKTGFSRAIRTDVAGVYNVVFSYINEDAGIYAALSSLEIVEALIKGKPYFIRHDINRLKNIYGQSIGKPTEKVKEVETIPYFNLHNQPVQFGYTDRIA